MNEQVIAVCDGDENYAMSLGGTLETALFGHYHISVFTGSASLGDYLADHRVDAAIISESAYDRKLIRVQGMELIILAETPDFVEENATIINRFQTREDLVKSVIESLPGFVEGVPAGRDGSRSWKVIGVYSPIRRCLQTSFAITLGQMLGVSHKTLYMNFENFSGFSGWFNMEFAGNMIDLLYYYECERDRLSLRIPLLVHHFCGLDILPPAEAGPDSYDRNGNRWTDVFDAVSQATDYEYLILDLSDSMSGLTDVLGYCDRIFTMVKNDTISQAKLAQYERWMTGHDMADVMGKTVKLKFPEFTDIPDRPDMLTHSELASYVSAIVKEDRI